MLIGSSGCGKTSTAFLVARERFVLYLEVFSGKVGAEGYQIVNDNVFITLKNGNPSFGDVERRLNREVMLRAVLLAIVFQRELSVGRVLTPYQWHLFMMSPKSGVLLDRLRKSQLQNGLDEIYLRWMLSSVEKLIKCKLVVVVDAAQQLVSGRQFLYQPSSTVETTPIDSFQAAVMALTSLSTSLAACVFCGTQMSLERSLRISSAVGKLEGEIPVYVFGKFPFLDGLDCKAEFSVGQSLSSCLKLDRVGLSPVDWAGIFARLQGRPRFTASLITMLVNMRMVQGQLEAVLDEHRVFVLDGLVKEIESSKWSQDDILRLWHCYLTCGSKGGSLEFAVVQPTVGQWFLSQK